MKATHIIVPAIALVAASLAGVASSSAQDSPQAQVPPYPPSVTVLNQKLKNDAVSITYAFLPKDGTLTILSGDPDKKSDAAALGSVALEAGDHRNIEVPLKQAPEAGTQLWAQVEQGKGEAGKPFATSDERAEQSFKTL